eukprot:3939786-Rhodomonas_salina.2
MAIGVSWASRTHAGPKRVLVRPRWACGAIDAGRTGAMLTKPTLKAPLVVVGICRAAEAIWAAE